MTRKKLIEELEKIVKEQEQGKTDKESDHAEADELLLKYIGNSKVTDLFKSIEKWYA